MYTQVGNYAAIAGLVVIVLAKIGVVTDADSVATIIGAGVTLYGIIKQFIAHKQLAIATGTSIK